jgi:hypothetical protein
MFSYELRANPWSYYWMALPRVYDMWEDQFFFGEWIKPGMWKDKEHGFFCRGCGDSKWNLALLITRSEKAWYERDLLEYNEKHLALAMAYHSRLGPDSVISHLGVPTDIFDFIRTINM